MNLDNKNGICCKCPGIMNYSRDFTQWQSSSIYEINLMKKLQIDNPTEYRNKLQLNGELIMKNTFDDYNKRHRCQNGDNLYLDLSNFHNFFNKNNNIDNNKDNNNINNNNVSLSSIP
jgi:hypothetical protein